MDNQTSLASEKELDEQFKLITRSKKFNSFKAPAPSASNYIPSSPKVTKPSITQEYYQSYSPVPMTTTTKPFPSFNSPTPQRAEYLPLEIDDEEDFLALQRLEEDLHAHQTKNIGFTAFIVMNIIFLLVVTILIYMMRTTTSTLGKSSANEHRIGGDGFSVEVDSITNRYFVIDHNPLPNFPFVNPINPTNPGDDNSKKSSSDDNGVTNHVILADGLFHRNLNNNGWNYLSIETMDLKSFAYRLNITKGHELSSSEQLSTIREQYIKNMKALGYLEGYLTCNEIKQYYENFYTDSFSNMNLTREAVDFLLLNYQWMSIQSEQYYSFSNYWLVVKGLLSQLNGMVQGARDGCSTFGNDYTVDTPGINRDNMGNSQGKKKTTSPSSTRGHSHAQSDSTTYQSSPNTPFTFQTILTASDYDKPELHYNDVFLPSMHKRPELIHFLLVNANGDLFQIKQKYEFIERDPESVSNEAIDRQDDDDDKVADEEGVDANQAAPASLFSEATVRRRMEEMSDALPKSQFTPPSPHLRSKSKSKLGKNKRSRTPVTIVTENRRNLASKLQQVLINNNHENPVHKKNRHHDHCSAIIKILPNASDIVFGHNTWDDFTNAAPRIFKHYSYTLLQGSSPNKKFDVYFSSSPGLLGSVDDFYIVHGYGHLAVLETS